MVNVMSLAADFVKNSLELIKLSSINKVSLV